MKTYRIDSGIIDAIENFIMYGLPPGSCAALLLQHEFILAHRHAHHLIKVDEEWLSHVNYVKDVVPDFVKGDNFHNWTGFTEPLAFNVGEHIMAERLGGGGRISELYDLFRSRRV